MRLSPRLFHCGLVTLVTLSGIVSLQACRNPASSTLPPSAVSRPATAFPPLPKGDVYADETVPPSDMQIDVGDIVDVVVRRGTGEDKFTGVVKESGDVGLSYLDVQVKGLTVAQAEAKIQDQLKSYIRDPRVQVSLKKKSLRVKKVFVFGDVKKPGMVPMIRNMTVLQAVASVENYNETALLEEVRVIRGDLNQPRVLVADLARVFTYGDLTRNVALEENDVVFVPREHLGDASEAAKKILPVVQVAITPFYPAFLVPAFFPGAVVK